MPRRLLVLIGLALVSACAGGPAAASAETPARVVTDIDYNQDEFGPTLKSLNSLDLYVPAIPDGARVGPRPLVVWVHGGSLMTGDKSNRMTDKVRLFNGLGYI